MFRQQDTSFQCQHNIPQHAQISMRGFQPGGISITRAWHVDINEQAQTHTYICIYVYIICILNISYNISYNTYIINVTVQVILHN